MVASPGRPAALEASRGTPWNPSETRRLLILVLASLVLFTYGLGTGTLWDQDEAKYASVARELLQTRDPFTLRLQGDPWFVHPPLFFWLQALTGRLFGFTEFTVRLWSAISGSGVVAAAFLLGRLLYDSRTGLLAGAVTATTLQVLGQARLAVFDPTLAACMLLALYMYLVAYTTGARRAHLWAWGWAGLATATKGPIGLALPAMTVVALWALRRDRTAWREIPPAGPLLYAAIGLPWYLIETVRHGEAFVRTAVGYYLLTRFFGVVENQPGPWWYYFPVLLLGMMPWTGTAPSAIARLLGRRRDLSSQVILLWCAITVVFYSAAGTKLPNYVLPVYPVLAVGIARLWEEGMDGVASAGCDPLRWAAALLPVPSALFAAAVIAWGWVNFPAEALALRTPIAVAAGIVAAGPLVAWGCLLARRRATALAALLLTPVAVVPVLVHQTLPAIEAYRPIPRVARLLRAAMGPDDGLVAVRMGTAWSLRWYGQRHVRWVFTGDALRDALCAPPRAFVVVPASEVVWARPHLPAEARLIADDAGFRVYGLDRPASCARAPGFPR